VRIELVVGDPGTMLRERFLGMVCSRMLRRGGSRSQTSEEVSSYQANDLTHDPRARL